MVLDRFLGLTARFAAILLRVGEVSLFDDFAIDG